MKKSQAKSQRDSWRQTVATVLAATRRDADVTQPELAAMIGWSRDKLAKVEAGQRRVELGDIVMIATALRQKPDALLRRILTW